MNIDLEDLKRKALAASSAPWVIEDELGSICSTASISSPDWGAFAEVVVRMDGENDLNSEGLANANYIAAASPAVILELIARLEVAEQNCQALADQLEVQRGVLANELEASASSDNLKRLGHTILEAKNEWADRAVKAESALLDKIAKLEAKKGDIIVWNRSDAIRFGDEMQRTLAFCERIRKVTGADVLVLTDDSSIDLATDEQLARVGLMRKPAQADEPTDKGSEKLQCFRLENGDMLWYSRSPAIVEVPEFSTLNDMLNSTQPVDEAKLAAELACPSSLHDAEPVRHPDTSRLHRAMHADISQDPDDSVLPSDISKPAKIHKATDAEIDELIAQVEAAGLPVPDLEFDGNSFCGANIRDKLKIRLLKLLGKGGAQ